MRAGLLAALAAATALHLAPHPRAARLSVRLRSCTTAADVRRAVRRQRWTEARASVDAARAELSLAPSASGPALDPDAEMSYLVALNALISGLGKARKWRQALALLEEAAVPEAPAAPSVQCYGAAMNALATARRGAEAQELLARMEERGVPANDFVRSAGLKAVGFDDWRAAVALLERWRAHAAAEGLPPVSEHAHSAAAAAAARHGEAAACRAIIDAMRATGPPPSRCVCAFVDGRRTAERE